MIPRLIFIWSCLLLFAGGSSFAQVTRKTLFLGNSYTAYNNLPQLVHDVALSAGDILVFDSNTPGGYTLEAHSLDPASQNKIMAGGWDYVVLQGQSQEPIIQTSDFYGGAEDLNALIDQYNPCAVTMFYVTWGRKNGDPANCAVFPPMCTYESMDSTLLNRYITIASSLDAELSPVSVVRKYLRQNYPGIELYQADESHPTLAGSYAAACCFYATIFKKDPTLISFDAGLNTTDAANIRNAAKTQVFDHLDDWDLFQLPQSGFNYSIGTGTNEVIFSPVNNGVIQTYFWDFGDGSNSTLSNPAHSYLSNGTYLVSLTTTNCNLDGTYTSTTDTIIQFCAHTPVINSIHSLLCEYDTLVTQSADSYQWFCAGAAIPETNQYLANYHQYPSISFSVLTTVSGCTELSQMYIATPEWLGYYFDAAYGGDPCEGDTALFIVLNATDTISNSVVIHWYKDGILLPAFNDDDTLLITTQGTYQCKLYDPLSVCPFDTTVSSEFVVDCTVGMENINDEVFWNLFPNPTSGIMTLQLKYPVDHEEIFIYSTTGYFMTHIKVNSSTQLDLSTFPPGQYYIRFTNHPHQAIRFIKM